MFRRTEHVGRRPGLRVGALAQRAGRSEFPPVAAETVEPLTAHMVIDVLDPIALRRDREIAVLRRRPICVSRGKMQGAEGAGPRKDVHAAVAAVISERRRDRIFDLRVGVVLDDEGEERRGHRGIAVVMGYERAERRHSHLSRKRFAQELDLGDRKPPKEHGVVEMRSAGHAVAVRAKAVSIELARAWRARRHALVGTVENAGVEKFAVALGFDSEMAIAVKLMDGGPIADAPIDKPPASGQRDAAGANPAERKGDVATARAAVYETVVDRGFRAWQSGVVHPVLSS